MSFINISSVALAGAMSGALAAQAGEVSKTASGAEFTTQGMNVSIEFYTPEIVRVHKVPQGAANHRDKSLVVVKEPEKTEVSLVEKDGRVTLASTALTVSVNPVSGAIEFISPTGKALLTDKDYGTTFADYNDAGKSSYRVTSSFLLDSYEPIFGIGQIMDGRFNRRNSSHHLQNENMSTYSPYFMSPTKGYAVYWDNYSISDMADTPQGISYTAIGDCLDYYFVYGRTPDGIIADMRELTGHAPMLPLWAYGFFQSKERYATQEELLDVLKKYRESKCRSTA